MSNSPFYLDTVPFAGVDPGEPQFWPTVPGEFWLGKPGNMIQLPSPMADGYEAPPSGGEIEHGLAGGASAATRFASDMRRWTLPYQRLTGRDYQVIAGFRKRLICGPGPWCYLPPEDTNRLTYAQSVCGALNGVAEGWTPGSGQTVAYDSTVAAAIAPCGVLRWSGAGNNSVLVAGGFSGSNPDADVLHSCPYVPSRPWSGSAFVAKASGTASARAQLAGIAADGVTVVASVDGPLVTLTTSPQRLSVSVTPGALGASAYVVLVVKCGTAAAPDLLVSCPSLSDTDLPNEWALGGGAPRVVWPVAPGRVVGWHMASDVTVTLAECITGAA
jgi:hypothetical protein